MTISLKKHLVKNVASAFINGLITLILLLIAPLGLASVIFITFTVTISTFMVTMTFDFITIWLLNSSHQQYFDRPLNNLYNNPITKQNNPDLSRRNDDINL
ncbi:MAG: hypothetical protein GW795_09060 [Cyanobacteria bacterium]|nr:hypothetical protein [Cyanobacteria bacterium CG_2015-16_32_12]NCO78150.1 hypothetical protein [Cyanobacteria bacterium CG_2015-22_32_23]NCQ04088.1 hypothetical protein [Cyanobacteria bacterium CG_2015-09_32_10]NCQ42020.1 hypothetical protein [Cyanobacteria bacterium CG_2015-04_32_10]NCS84084.1 hypothetical protein [Cyanobacteria bacterium CG_2015-02_32_10]